MRFLLVDDDEVLGRAIRKLLASQVVLETHPRRALARIYAGEHFDIETDRGDDVRDQVGQRLTKPRSQRPQLCGQPSHSL